MNNFFKKHFWTNISEEVRNQIHKQKKHICQIFIYLCIDKYKLQTCNNNHKNNDTVQNLI